MTELMETTLEMGKLDKIKELVEKGANINEKDEKGWTALTYAAGRGYIDAVKYLVEKGANINEKDIIGWTPLMHAARYNHNNVVEYLVKKGASINEKDNRGFTALVLATREGHINVVKTLLENCKQWNIEFPFPFLFNPEEKSEYTLLMLAAMKGYINITKYLLEKGNNIDKETSNGWTALMLAALYGHTDIVNILIGEKADINKENNKGWTALMLAALCGHTDIVNILIGEKADINKENKKGNTALILAAKKGHTYIVERLIEKGADVHKENNAGNTALMHAVKNGYTDIVKCLLRKGAKLKEGEKFLISALKKGNYSIAEQLILAGLNLNYRDDKGKNLLEYILESTNLKLLKMVILKKNENDKQYENKIDITSSDTINSVNNFVKRQSNIDKKTIEFLLDNGLDVNKIEKDITVGLFKGKNNVNAVGVIDKLLQSEKSAAIEVMSKNAKEIDIIEKESDYRIILRDENGKAILRYTHKIEQNECKFIKIEKKDRRLLLNALHKIKKLVKHICRRRKMSIIPYKNLRRDGNLLARDFNKSAKITKINNDIFQKKNDI